jgi:hypothetical protein
VLLWRSISLSLYFYHEQRHTHIYAFIHTMSPDTLSCWIALIFSRPRDTDGEFRLRGGLTHVFAHESEEDITSLHPPSWTHDVSMWMPAGLTDDDVAALWERDELVRILSFHASTDRPRILPAPQNNALPLAICISSGHWNGKRFGGEIYIYTAQDTKELEPQATPKRSRSEALDLIHRP